MGKLNAKNTLFVKEYLIDFNGTQAAIRAGYSKKTAYSIGSELLNKPVIQAGILEALEARMEKLDIDARWVLDRLIQEATADVADLYDENGDVKSIHDWPLIWRQGLVAGVDVVKTMNDDGPTKITKIKLSDRIKRIELLGKHIDVMAFATKVEHTGANGEPLHTGEVSDMELARRLAYLLQKPTHQSESQTTTH